VLLGRSHDTAKSGRVVVDVQRHWTDRHEEEKVGFKYSRGGERAGALQWQRGAARQDSPPPRCLSTNFVFSLLALRQLEHEEALPLTVLFEMFAST
jgi:hypothetical protein